MKKGFVISISALLLLMVIVLFSQGNKKRTMEDEKAIIDSDSIDSAAYFFDDVADDLAYILGPGVEISRNSSESSITFREQLPRSADEGSLLSNYSRFLADYSERMNAEVYLNLSGISNGTLLIFSNDLRYDRNSTSAKFYSSSGSTNASAYEISIYSGSYRISEDISNLSGSGTMKLIIHYSDLNGSIDVSGAFDPNSQAIYSATYGGDSPGSLLIRLGNLSGKTGSMGVEQAGSVGIWLNLTARGGWNRSLDYAYNANMSYRQVNVLKEDAVWVGEG